MAGYRNVRIMFRLRRSQVSRKQKKGIMGACKRHTREHAIPLPLYEVMMELFTCNRPHKENALYSDGRKPKIRIFLVQGVHRPRNTPGTGPPGTDCLDLQLCRDR